MADDSELDYLRTLLLEIMPGFTVKHYSEVKTISLINDTKRALLYPGEILTFNDVYYDTRYKLKVSAPNEANLITGIKNLIDGAKNYNRRLDGPAEITIVTFTLTMANMTDASTFTFVVDDGDGTTTPYYVWFDKVGTTADPGGTGTGIEADVSGATTAAQVAEIVKALIHAKSDVACTRTGDYITVTNANNGNVTDAVEEITGTGCEFDITTQGGFTTCASLTHIKIASSNQAYEVGTTKRWNIDIMIDITWSVS